MDFESETDPAAEFLNRERAELGELEQEIGLSSNVESAAAEEAPLSSDDFEMINNNEVPAGDNDDLAGMSFAHQTVVHEVPEKIKKWRENQAKMLEDKDENEKLTIEKLRKDAEKELKDWYDTYRNSKEKTKTINRDAEKDMSTADTNGSNDDTIWEKISTLCDFGAQAKAPKNGRDTTRMRSIFLQLKSSPLAAKNN